MTGLTLFVSSWLALFLSKQVTRPVEALADAMDAMASGDYGSRVDIAASGELGELMRSFNHMATDLENSRTQLESSTYKLSEANAAIDERRRELETVLETIPSGVATLDNDLRILQANRAFCEMLDPLGELPIEGQPIQSLFPTESALEIGRVLRRSRRLPAATTEIEARSSRGPLHLIFTVTQLRGSLHGHLVVMDNVTDVLRAQKQMAWKEVAQRVAHEIKNPLTPIALSAERIERHIGRGLTEDSAQVLRSSTEVIRSSVETLRQLVDQFAALADFPAANRTSTDLNRIVENTLTLFAGRLEGIEVRLRLAENLPPVLADPEALKRAFSNLIDNAAEAMQSTLAARLDRAHRNQRNHGGNRDCRHRPRHHRRNPRAAVSAILLHPPSRHRTRPFHRSENCPGTSRQHPRRNKFSRRRPLCHHDSLCRILVASEIAAPSTSVVER